MNITLEEKKLKAIELMTKLDIYKPYIKGFKDENEVCYFERFAGFWAFQDAELVQKIKEIEQKHNCLVYAVTHEFTEFGECYDLLIASDYKEEWDYELEKIDPNTAITVYLVNNLIKKGLISKIEYGNACLINIDELADFFSKEQK